MFICHNKFVGKDLNANDITINKGSELNLVDGILCYNSTPICFPHSQVAKDYLIWNGDGQYNRRSICEDVIIFNPRERTWTETEKRIDPETGEETEVEVTRTARFLPEEAEYMFNHFPQFFTDDRFNDYFYTQSHIEEVEALADYLTAQNNSFNK